MGYTLKEATMRDTSKLNYLACVVCLFAFTTIVGFVSGNQLLFGIGQSFGFSPMPLPFREFDSGDENISGHFSGTLFKDGYGMSMSSDDIVTDFSLHSRPHRAAIPFYTLANYFSVIPDAIKRSGFRYICNKYNGEKMVAHIQYATHTYHYNVPCSN